MKTTYKILSVFSLLALFALTFATPALAFDGRGGDKITIKADEVINDDLYVTANEFVLDGIVKGDLIVFGQTITINGTVEGDLLAAGQIVIINGKVMDDARIAGAGLQIGKDAVIGSDLLVGGASLETKKGSAVRGEIVFGSGQALLAGDVTGDVLGGTAALQLDGSFGGNVEAYVDVTEGAKSSPPMNIYMMNIPISLPNVKPGLTVADSARITGNLKYTSTVDLPIPSGVVGGKVTRTAPQVSAQTRYIPPTAAQKVGTWVLDILRTMITMILFGLLLGWLFPVFMKALPDKIKSQPWGSLGWGAIAWAAFFFGLLLIVLVMIFGGLIFGFLTLGGVSGSIIWLGLLALFGVTIVFVLVTSYLTKIIVGDMMGKWILNRTSPTLADHKFWPMVIGVAVLIFIIELFRFPLLPIGFFGWLINFTVILCGLGALWIWGRDALRARKTS
jgi:cytoskeletal protein CcmA (bactofilin family)